MLFFFPTLALYVFICYHPILVLYVPFLVLFVLFSFQIFLRSIKYQLPRTIASDVESESALNGLKALRKALEIDVPIRRNMTELQNMMGDFADGVDWLLGAFSYHMVEESPFHIIFRWLALVFSFIFFYISSKFFSPNALFALTGTGLLICCHPWIRCFLTSLLLVTLDGIHNAGTYLYI